MWAFVPEEEPDFDHLQRKRQVLDHVLTRPDAFESEKAWADIGRARHLYGVALMRCRDYEAALGEVIKAREIWMKLGRKRAAFRELISVAEIKARSGDLAQAKSDLTKLLERTQCTKALEPYAIKILMLRAGVNKTMGCEEAAKLDLKEVVATQNQRSRTVSQQVVQILRQWDN